jgi:hypothetical protein
MPVTPCVNTRDSIDQSAGRVLTNHFDYPDPEHIVTSYCRVSDGTWVAWKNRVFGDSTDPDSGIIGNDENKGDWPSLIASALAVGVGYFPDDEAAPVVYQLGIDPLYTWDQGLYAGRDPCSHFPLIGDHYADNQRAVLTSWSMFPIDVQVRTDGTNVWVIALAREAVKYPFLYSSPTEIDDCGHHHPTLEGDWEAAGNNPFTWDTSTGNRFWFYGEGAPGGDKPFGDYDDPGQNMSLRWQPARVTVFAGDIGGFTKLDTIEASFDNANHSTGLCSGIEAAASPAEPGVLHLLWSEGGQFGVQTVAPQVGQRINYSRWDFTSKTLDTDLLYVEEFGSGYVSDADWIWTAEMVLRNDHGSPIAIVWPWVTNLGPQNVSAEAEFWDLSSGSINVLQIADVSLAPTADEGNVGTTPQSVFGFLYNSSLQIGSLGFDNIRRSQYASSFYVDPTLDNTNVYLLCVGYGQGDQQSGCKAFLRIPCDGSATFDYMDGVRLSNYSIIPGDSFLDSFGSTDFIADFVSDTQNVWMPAKDNAGGAVLHLTRICERTWELLAAWPDNGTGSGYETGAWGIEAFTQPPELLTDDSDQDWLVGGGNGPLLTILSSDPTNIAQVRAQICRCFVPCLERIGLHIWEQH